VTPGQWLVRIPAGDHPSLVVEAGGVAFQVPLEPLQSAPRHGPVSHPPRLWALLARVWLSAGVTVDAHTKLRLTHTSLKRSALSHPISSPKAGCWVTEAPSSPRRRGDAQALLHCRDQAPIQAWCSQQQGQVTSQTETALLRPAANHFHHVDRGPGSLWGDHRGMTEGGTAPSALPDDGRRGVLPLPAQWP